MHGILTSSHKGNTMSWEFYFKEAKHGTASEQNAAMRFVATDPFQSF